MGARELAEAGFDAVIVAVGGKNAWPRIEGIGAPFVLDSWDVLRGTYALKGNVAVIGGGLVGAETAEYIANEMPDCHVTVVEMADKVAAQESNTVLPTMMADFQEHGVELLTGAKVVEFVENPGYTPAVVVEVAGSEGEAPERREIPCDFAVLALGTSPVSFDAAPLEEAGIPVTFVGDCHEVAAIDEAVTAGYLAACAL